MLQVFVYVVEVCCLLRCLYIIVGFGFLLFGFYCGCFKVLFGLRLRWWVCLVRCCILCLYCYCRLTLCCCRGVVFLGEFIVLVVLPIWTIVVCLFNLCFDLLILLFCFGLNVVVGYLVLMLLFVGLFMVVVLLIDFFNSVVYFFVGWC